MPVNEDEGKELVFATRLCWRTTGRDWDNHASGVRRTRRSGQDTRSVAVHGGRGVVVRISKTSGEQDEQRVVHAPESQQP
jgi:hypothetical protein